MKKEEVIDWLMIMKANLNSFPPEVSGVRKIEALAEAIRLLKNEESEIPTGSTTKNDLGVDCISRQSVLDKIQRLIDAEQNNIDENGDYMNYARERVNAYEAIQFFVENDCLCPSVTPQEPIRPKGKWISHHCGAYYECSNCHERNNSRYDNYCKFCGAKMEEVEE